MYKPELKQETIELISLFFKEERGNRITKFNIDGLLAAMHVIFEKHKVSDKKKDGK